MVATHEQSGGGSIASVEMWQLDLANRYDLSHKAPGDLAAMDFDSTGLRLIVAPANGAWRELDLKTGGSIGLRTQNAFKLAAFAPNMTSFAGLADDGTLHVISMSDGKELASVPHKHEQYNVDEVLAIAFSADGSQVFDITSQGNLETTDAHTGMTHVVTTIAGCCNVAAFSSNAKWVVYESTDGAHVADAATGDVVSGFSWRDFDPDFSPARTLAISSDGKYAAVGSGTDQLLLLAVPQGPTKESYPDEAQELGLVDLGKVKSVLFSADGNVLAGAADDGTVSLLEVPTGREILRINEDYPLKQLAIANSGWLATGSESGVIHIWSLDPQAMLGRFCNAPGTNLTTDQWQHSALQDLPPASTCAGWAER
jgi:WD40 repeat protein